MKKKKTTQFLAQRENLLARTTQEASELQMQHLAELESNPKYSLNVDPENKYNMSDVKKNFIQNYINFRNVNTAAQICKLDQEVANEWFVSYPVQQEIRRINMALYQRRFASKLISLDELSGYLSTMLTDEFVPLAEQLAPMEKLRVIEMLLKINDMKKESFDNPSMIMAKDVEIQIKDLSIATIKQLLEQKNMRDENAIVIDKIEDAEVLSPEEKSYLETLPTNELLKLVDDVNKGKKNKGGK